jgi:hypothetical protein
MAITSQGTVISIGNADGPPETFTTIGEVIGFTGPDTSRSSLNTTTLADTIVRTATGILDWGTVTLNLRLNFGDAGQDRVRTVYGTNARTNFRIAIPQGALGSAASSTAATLAFSGYIMAVQFASGQVDQLVEKSITIKLDSAITES